MKITTFSEPKELVKEGLLFYSSDANNPLVDSKGIAHNITPADIQALADNTNKYLELTDIYVFKEHDRNPENALGLISTSGCFEAKEITKAIAKEHPKLNPLVGRWGLFCNNVKLVNETIIDKVNQGLMKSVSIGADLVNNVVKELSITATPAAAGSSLFSSGNLVNFNMETTAVTLEEALQTNEDTEQLKSEAIELLCTLLAVIDNIAAMSDEELGVQQVASKEELYQAQMESFLMMLDEKINPFTNAEIEQQQQVDPRMQQPGAMPVQYSYPDNITTFEQMDNYISEYGFVNALRAGVKVASKTAGFGNKTKVMGNALGKGILGKKKFGAAQEVAGAGMGKLNTGVKAVKTGIANTASTGLNKVESLSNKLAVKPGVLGKVAGGIQKRSASLADKIGKRRLARYSTNSKLSKFIK